MKRAATIDINVKLGLKGGKNQEAVANCHVDVFSNNFKKLISALTDNKLD